VTGGTAGQAQLDARFVKGKRERLLARAFMIGGIVGMTLMPQARAGRDRRAGRGPRLAPRCPSGAESSVADDS
jgi:hypothetical protein